MTFYDKISKIEFLRRSMGCLQRTTEKECRRKCTLWTKDNTTYWKDAYPSAKPFASATARKPRSIISENPLKEDRKMTGISLSNYSWVPTNNSVHLTQRFSKSGVHPLRERDAKLKGACMTPENRYAYAIFIDSEWGGRDIFSLSIRGLCKK